MLATAWLHCERYNYYYKESNTFMEDCCLFFCVCLQAGNSIEWLDVSHCGLESGDVGCLRSLCALQVVNLAGNAFTHHNLQSLCRYVCCNGGS